jgi:hypothetical protein
MKTFFGCQRAENKKTAKIPLIGSQRMQRDVPHCVHIGKKRLHLLVAYFLVFCYTFYHTKKKIL